MANKYSKSNTQNKDSRSSDMERFEEKRRRLNTGAKIMAIIVSLAMIVTAFLSAGVFLFR